jgi:hypothetical protein
MSTDSSLIEEEIINNYYNKKNESKKNEQKLFLILGKYNSLLKIKSYLKCII